MDYKKLAENVAINAISGAIERKNIGQIAEKTAETVLTEVVNSLPPSDKKSEETKSDTDNVRGNIISSLVALLGHFLRKLFK